jgi:hypothetical protein
VAWRAVKAPPAAHPSAGGAVEGPFGAWCSGQVIWWRSGITIHIAPIDCGYIDAGRTHLLWGRGRNPPRAFGTVPPSIRPTDRQLRTRDVIVRVWIDS